MVDMISAGAAARPRGELVGGLEEAFRQKAAAEGTIVVLMGEVSRSQVYRDDGATSPETWAAERFGVSVSTARGLTHLGEKAWDIPRLVGSLGAGDLSLDKFRAVAEVTPENEPEYVTSPGLHSCVSGRCRPLGAKPLTRPGRRSGQTGVTCASTTRAAP